MFRFYFSVLIMTCFISSAWAAKVRKNYDVPKDGLVTVVWFKDKSKEELYQALLTIAPGFKKPKPNEFILDIDMGQVTERVADCGRVNSYLVTSLTRILMNFVVEDGKITIRSIVRTRLSDWIVKGQTLYPNAIYYDCKSSRVFEYRIFEGLSSMLGVEGQWPLSIPGSIILERAQEKR